jgi:broad specificity polyphosphatase/5'/3'-nucleotidase SurE
METGEFRIARPGKRAGPGGDQRNISYRRNKSMRSIATRLILCTSLFAILSLPATASALNINFPVPYGDIVGVETTVLADGSDLELPLFDPSQGFPQLGIPPLPFPSCDDAISMGGACFAAVGVGFSPDEGPKTDLGAHRDNYISITPYSADMTGPDNGISGALKQLDP